MCIRKKNAGKKPWWHLSKTKQMVKHQIFSRAQVSKACSRGITKINIWMQKFETRVNINIKAHYFCVCLYKYMRVDVLLISCFIYWLYERTCRLFWCFEVKHSLSCSGPSSHMFSFPDHWESPSSICTMEMGIYICRVSTHLSNLKQHIRNLECHRSEQKCRS